MLENVSKFCLVSFFVARCHLEQLFVLGIPFVEYDK